MSISYNVDSLHLTEIPECGDPWIVQEGLPNCTESSTERHRIRIAKQEFEVRIIYKSCNIAVSFIA